MGLNYQIAITSVAFDNSYNNVLRFDSRSEQEAYFNVNTLFSSTTPEVNFNVGSLHATNVCFDCGENEALNELLSKNYCIIKDNTPNATLKYYYYFITNAMQDNANRIKMSLELDIFQTYYIDLNFGDNIVYKAHLNRFIDNGNGTVSFDGRPESKLFEREDIQNVAKRMTKRTNVNLYPNTELGNWLNENILGWIYIYADPYHTYKVGNVTDTTQAGNFVPREMANDAKAGGFVPANIAIFTYPIYKTDKYMRFNNSAIVQQAIWGTKYATSGTQRTILDYFAQGNDGFDFIYAVKFSVIPPFTNDVLENITYNINTSNNLIVDAGVYEGKIINPFIDTRSTGVSSNILTFSVTYFAPDFRFFTMANIGYQSTEFTPQNYTVNKELTFNISDIIGGDKDSKFNPKLLSSDYFELHLGDQTEDSAVYDLQKLNKNNLEIAFTESLVPDMTKKYIRFKNLSGIYINETSENLTGFVGNNDSSLLLPAPAYQSMIANNKNYFLQNSTNRAFDLTKGVVGAGLGVVGGFGTDKTFGKALGIAGGLWSGISAGLNYSKSVINENLTVDNLKNAPSKITGAKGNVIFENMYSDNGIIVEEWDILDNEKEMINDYMCLYGFTYNRVDNVKNVNNIRKYYNYVRANVETISGLAISEVVHKKFKECFANGIRFWNTDTFDYTKENYEQWLENTKFVKAQFNNTGSISQTVTTTTDYGDTTTNSVLYTYKDAILTFSLPAPYMFIIENVDTDATEYSIIYSNVLRYTNATYINIDYKIVQGI